MRGLWILLPLALTACGGRVARPVETVQAVDARLSCEHIEAEFANNRKRVAELTGERGERQRDNVGMLLVSPLFLDLSQTEQKEAKAIAERNRRLAELAGQKSCPIRQEILASLSTEKEQASSKSKAERASRK